MKRFLMIYFGMISMKKEVFIIKNENKQMI